MAFDQNSMPKDLRPLNIPRTATEEPRIAAASTAGRAPDGFFLSPARETGSSSQSVPVYYPAAVPDAGYVAAGYRNVAPGGVSYMPVPVGQVGVSVPAGGFEYSPNMGNRMAPNAVDQASSDVVSSVGYGQSLSGRRVGSNGSDQVNGDLGSVIGFSANSENMTSRSAGSGYDQASEEGGDDSVSGKKVKFLCSFGGKILPRPSDGALRYVGGQTRIIGVRRDVSFNELMQKMVDTYGQHVVIKYQLPDEDLDALVSVSCPDDLENMMDEHDKLVERSSDGPAKLRLFLFSASELDPSGMVQFRDLHDSGQRYVEAVNGIMEGGSGGIVRKESITSATSTQNSDISGTELLDSSGAGQVDVAGPITTYMLSPKGNSTTSNDSASRIVGVEPNSVAYTDASGVPLGIPLVRSGPQQTLSSQPEMESEKPVVLGVPQPQVGMNFQQTGGDMPISVPPAQTYVDQRQEAMNHAEYLNLSPQMGYPSSPLLGTPATIYPQQQFHDSAASITSHQFIPAMHVMAPSSSHVGLRPAMVQPMMQHQQMRLDHYPEDGAFTSRVVQLPVDQGYNAFQAQVAPGLVKGGYVWPQVLPPEHVVFSDGSVHNQVIHPEKFLRPEECNMCQKNLPHAHSDPLVPEQRDCGASPLSNSSPVYHSLRPEDAMRFLQPNRVVVTGPLREGIVEQGSGLQPRMVGHMDQQIGMPQLDAIRTNRNVGAPLETERGILHKMDNPDYPNASVTHGTVGLVGEGQPSHSMVVGCIPQSNQEDGLQQHFVPSQYLVKQEALLNKPVNSEASSARGMHNQASEYLINESPKDHYGKVGGATPKTDTASSYLSHEHQKPIDGMMETLQISTPDAYVTAEQKPLPVDTVRNEDVLSHKQAPERDLLLDGKIGIPCTTVEVNQSKASDVLPCSSAEANYAHYSQPMVSYEMAQPSLLGDVGVYTQTNMGIQRNQPTYAPQNDDPMILPPNVLNDAEAFPTRSNAPTSLSATGRPGDVYDATNSLLSIQDPWNHFPPPKPSKIPIKKQTPSPRHPFSDNLLGIYGELNTNARSEEGAQQPLSHSNREFNIENARSSKGSSEDLVKQELKAVAEGVAASVFQSGTSSNPDVSAHERRESANEPMQETEVPNGDTEPIHESKFEDLDTKMPERVNIGFPVSDGIGRLQIIKNSDLEELRELGSGTFGTVYHGKWRGTDVAIKRINGRCFAGKPSEQERMIDDFWNEAIKLADLHHPNVVAFYGVVLDGPGGSVATVTEFMVNGSLRTALQKNERSLDKRKRLLIAMDVAFGMEYLHGKKIVHFDLKSDNLLVNLRDPQRPICKVGDLGLSKVKCQTLISGGVRGTLPWMAPELLNGSSSLVSEKVDVFSFGIVLWELLTGEEPYADLHYGAIIGGIVSNTLRPPIPDSCDPDWKSLMERCWSAEPSERPNFTEIANELRSMAAKIPTKGQNAAQTAIST